MTPVYDRIGISYSGQRRTDPRIAVQINTRLQGATRVVNIGAGTGSYEPEGVDLVAVEPSSEMIAQRRVGAYPAVQACAEQLPFEADSFSHALTVLSMHHWSDRDKAFREINRVATSGFVAVSWNPACEPFWLTRDYFPEIHAEDTGIFPDMHELEACFDQVEITPLMIPDDCQDGFLAAYWKRPEAYLQEEVRRSISSFAKMGDASSGLKKLKEDIESGAWAEKNRDILDKPVIDAGYIIVTAMVKPA